MLGGVEVRGGIARLTEVVILVNLVISSDEVVSKGCGCLTPRVKLSLPNLQGGMPDAADPSAPCAVVGRRAARRCVIYDSRRCVSVADSKRP